MLGRAYPFQSTCVRHRPTPSFRGSPVVALKIELSATRLSAVSGQPALDYRSSRAPRSRTETLLLPKQACFRLHLCPLCQSERPDLNRGHRRKALVARGPRPGAIPGFATFCLEAPRRRIDLLSADRKSAILTRWTNGASCARGVRASGPGGARIPVSWFSPQVLHRLSYRPNEKRPDVACDTRPFGLFSSVRPSVTSATDRTGHYRRMARSLSSPCVLGSNSVV